MIVFQLFVLFSCWFAAGLLGVRILDPSVHSNNDRATWVVISCLFGPLILLAAAAKRIPWGTFDNILFPSSAPKRVPSPAMQRYIDDDPQEEPRCIDDDCPPECAGDHDPDQLHLL